MKNSKIFKLLCLATVIFVFYTSQSHLQEPINGIYYHSKDQQAFILSELGTNTQTVIEVTGYDYVYGPGLSPQHDWFAYATGESNLTSLNVFSMNDNNRINVEQIAGLDGGFFSEISWSKNTDSLIFTYTTPQNEITEVLIFHPTSSNFIRFESQTSSNGFDHIRGIDWLPDDTGIAVYHRSVIELFDISGDPIDAIEANLDSNISPTCGQNTPNNVVNDRLIYVTQDANELINYHIETREVLSSVEITSDLEMAFWSSDGQFALLFFARPQTTVLREYDVWLYSATNNGLIQINSEQGIRKPNYCDGRFSDSLWDNHLAVLATTEGDLLLVDAEAANTLSIAPDATGRLNSNAPIIWSSDPAVNFVWYSEEIGYYIYRYNIASENLNLVAPADIGNFNPINYFSLFQNSLVAYSDNGNLVVSSTPDNQTLSPTIEYPEDGVYGVVNFEWHPQGNWLLVTSPFAGTSVVTRFTMLNLEDGSQQFLTDCPVNESACFDWLYEE